jgi:hypothetical protein
MSEEKKKLGVEDLVEAQRETAEQLKIIAERLDWICDAESPAYFPGLIWFWIILMGGLLWITGVNARTYESAISIKLGLLTFSVIILVAYQMKNDRGSYRRQKDDRLLAETKEHPLVSLAEQRRKKK